MGQHAEGAVNISKIVQEIADATPAKGLSVAEMLERIGSEGLLIAVMVLSVPFLLPISIPGSSIPFGFLIILICNSIIRSAPLTLPKRLGRMRISQHHMRMIAGRAVSILQRVERFCKPRVQVLMSTKLLRNVHALSMSISSICLMLPLPLPLSNTIPAYGIVFFALGLLRRDGAMVISGYGMLAAILTYLTLVYMLGVTGVNSLFG